LRELIAASEESLELPAGSRAGDAWSILMQRHPSLVELQRSTRIARNGRIVAFDELLVDGDELALLPPVGGG
jgi:molybdopterin converting factor small subunit